MISFKEVTGDITLADIPIAHQQNIQELLKRANVVREKWGKPMRVTSGYRTQQDHLRIYSEINARRTKQGLEPLKVPMSSKHLSGQAIDISDPRGELQQWLMKNADVLLTQGLWCESFDHTLTWVHFQIVPPRSGKRFFIP